MSSRVAKIESLLTMVGADRSDSTVDMLNKIIAFIPDDYLFYFTQYVLKRYDKYKKPLVNITTASQNFKKILILEQIKRGEFSFKTPEEVRDFLLEFFVGQEICNCVEPLYFDFVTIGLNENSEFTNNYAQKKLTSDQVNNFIFWCFYNQKKIGIVKIIKTEIIQELLKDKKLVVEPQTHEELKNSQIHPEMLALIRSSMGKQSA